MLGDPVEAEDVVQAAWLRLQGSETRDDIESLPAWLTTVTTRLCLDRMRQRVPDPVDLDDGAPEVDESAVDPAEEVALADTVGIALQVVLDRLTPTERVAFVLHDSFGMDFPTIGEILGRTPAATRKLASRARGKVAQPSLPDQSTDWVVVDAFLSAARGGDLSRLLELLAPDAVCAGDAAAIVQGTPERIEGRDAVAAMFNGAAKSALPVLVGTRPGAAWYLKGEAKVVFDFTIVEGRVTRIDFRADPDVVASVTRRKAVAE
jgi:RNA polymerase sigma-70 factor (ECF subfamily)